MIWFVSGLSGATSADVVMAIVRQTNQADKAEKAADTGECVLSMRVGFCFLGFFFCFLVGVFVCGPEPASPPSTSAPAAALNTNKILICA